MAIPPTPIFQRNIITFDNLAHHIELGRRLLLVRHAERVDRCFQRTMGDWIHRMFPDKTEGTYNRVNLNMPRNCPGRGEKKEEYNLVDYKSDTPLTAIGECTAERLGWRIFRSNLKITRVYSSPSLRCMQTCNRLLQGFCEAQGDPKTKQNYPMNIEPAIFDFCGFAETQFMVPNFLPSEFVVERGFHINSSYKSAMTADKLVAMEEIGAFYKRMQVAIDKILEDTKAETDGSILVVTHGPVMDAISQNLLQFPPRATGMFPKVANYPSYLATMVLEENRVVSSPVKWRLAPPPIKSFTYGANPAFDWKKLMNRR